MREIEVKLKAKNFEEIERKLKDKGCILSEPINQHDVIYSLKSSIDEFELVKEGDVIIQITRKNRSCEFLLPCVIWTS
ncbi:MAG: hypothetical protein HYT68_01895 [Candidatus Zambryskibacteria bacterium]|nr:hypothetical protein [Candidatus Zambryskibacteria bacterium]